MKQFKAYSELFIVIACTFVFLGLNTLYGDVLGFKAFVSQEHRVVDTQLVLSSRFIPVKAGREAIVSKPLHNFKGVVTVKNSELFLEDGTISMPIDNGRLYHVIVDVKIVYLLSTVLGAILVRSVYDKTKEKKIKGLK